MKNFMELVKQIFEMILNILREIGFADFAEDLSSKIEF